jgi:hypothetical protein
MGVEVGFDPAAVGEILVWVGVHNCHDITKSVALSLAKKGFLWKGEEKTGQGSRI